MTDHEPVWSERSIPGDGIKLHGKIAAPIGQARARLLVLHGYGDHCGRYARVVNWMASRGVFCLTFDQRGHGQSPGRRGFVRRWDEFLADLRCVLKGMESSPAPLFVLGHSHGGLVAAAAGERGILQEANVAGCILTSPYLATRLVPPLRRRLLALAANCVMPSMTAPTGLSPAMLTSDPDMIAEDRADPVLTRVATPRWYFSVIAAQRQVRADAGKFTLPLLALSGAADVVADPAAVREFVDRAGSPDKTFHLMPGMVHELLRETAREAVFARISDWIFRRLTP